MAENKKSVIVYCDWIHTFENLNDNEAGVLIKHFLRYVNDLDPVAPDKLTQIAFEPIKQQLKRDLSKWDEIRAKRSEAGLASAEKRKQNQQVLTSVESVQQVSTNPTVNVNVNDTVNVNVKKKGLTEKQNLPLPELIEVIAFFKEKKYAEQVARNFYDFYSASNWIDTKGNKVTNWEQKAIGWQKGEKQEIIPLNKNMKGMVM